MNDDKAPTKNVSARTLDLLGEAIVAGRYPPGSAVPITSATPCWILL